MNSSIAATLPLIHTSSHHQRVRALFFCSSSHTGASSSSPLPTRLSLAVAMHHTHYATWRRDAAQRLEAYSPKCREGVFSEVRGRDTEDPAPEKREELFPPFLPFGGCLSLMRAIPSKAKWLSHREEKPLWRMRTPP